MATQSPLQLQVTTVTPWITWFWIIAGILFLVAVVYFFFYAASMDIIGPTITSSPMPTSIDGASGVVVGAGGFPVGQITDYGLQYWMYIDNWDYRFGQEKVVLQRVDPFLCNPGSQCPLLSSKRT